MDCDCHNNNFIQLEIISIIISCLYITVNDYIIFLNFDIHDYGDRCDDLDVWVKLSL